MRVISAGMFSPPSQGSRSRSRNRARRLGLRHRPFVIIPLAQSVTLLLNKFFWSRHFLANCKYPKTDTDRHTDTET